MRNKKKNKKNKPQTSPSTLLALRALYAHSDYPNISPEISLIDDESKSVSATRAPVTVEEVKEQAPLATSTVSEAKESNWIRSEKIAYEGEANDHFIRFGSKTNEYYQYISVGYREFAMLGAFYVTLTFRNRPEALTDLLNTIIKREQTTQLAHDGSIITLYLATKEECLKFIKDIDSVCPTNLSVQEFESAHAEVAAHKRVIPAEFNSESMSFYAEATRNAEFKILGWYNSPNRARFAAEAVDWPFKAGKSAPGGPKM